MAHKRVYVRVPIAGEATLSSGGNIHTKTSTIDISQGGIGLINPSEELGQSDYMVEVTTAEGTQIQFSATLVGTNKNRVGFKTSDIDKKNLQVIADLVEEFQSTEKFIEQIDTQDLLEQSFIDDDGNEVSVTFDIGHEQ